jgi:cytochrome c oxidase subunit 2
LWTTLPLIYLALLFHWGFLGYANIYTAPGNSKPLRVVAQKWMWTVQYPDDEIEVSGKGAVIGVPLNQPVQLTMSSQDVIHSFFVPNFRVKQDVVPGRYTQLWFEATQVGEFPVFCAEYCGDQHSNMMAIIKVMPQDEYKAWIDKVKSAGAALSPLDLGKKLYVSKGCNACHSVDGKPGIAPTFKGLYGHSVELQTGGPVTADDNYIRESILEPSAKIVKGFPPVMPTFKGQLSEADINGLIEFIKSLK